MEVGPSEGRVWAGHRPGGTTRGRGAQISRGDGPVGEAGRVVGGPCSVIVNPGKTNPAVKEDACGIRDPRKQGFFKFENLLEEYGGIET